MSQPVEIPRHVDEPPVLLACDVHAGAPDLEEAARRLTEEEHAARHDEDRGQ